MNEGVRAAAAAAAASQYTLSLSMETGWSAEAFGTSGSYVAGLYHHSRSLII